MDFKFLAKSEDEGLPGPRPLSPVSYNLPHLGRVKDADAMIGGLGDVDTALVVEDQAAGHVERGIVGAVAAPAKDLPAGGGVVERNLLALGDGHGDQALGAGGDKGIVVGV